MVIVVVVVAVVVVIAVVAVVVVVVVVGVVPWLIVTSRAEGNQERMRLRRGLQAQISPH